MKFTHRGPLIDNDFISEAQVLFAGGIPRINEKERFSLQWSGLEPIDNTVSLFKIVLEVKTVEELFKKVDDFGVYYGTTSQLLMTFV